MEAREPESQGPGARSQEEGARRKEEGGMRGPGTYH